MLKHRIFLLGIVALVAMTSCASFKPISQIEGVVDVDWTLHKGTNASGEEIKPDRIEAGKTYYVSVRYLQDVKGKKSWKNLYSYEGLSLTTNDQAFIVKSFTFAVPNDPFYIFNKAPITVTVDFPAPISKTMTKKISFALDPTLPSFKGANGERGEDGDPNGRGNAKHGKTGGRGGDAGNIDLEIARYDTKGTSLESQGPLVIVHDIQAHKIWLISPRNGRIIINATGGDGGKGGKGADMTIKEGSADFLVQGGNGGDGGTGGHGASARVIVPQNSSIEDMFTVYVGGGDEGPAGRPGTGERKDTDNAGLNFISSIAIEGLEGKEGSVGSAGRVFTEKKNLSEMFQGISSPFFERSRIIP
jgi:hypothetical protein